MTSTPTVAALFVDRLGPYSNRCDVDLWDEARDARAYSADLPVVAHPPCGPWGCLRRMCRKQPEIDASCMPAAVAAVRRCGGVLEQPKGSSAFRVYGLPLPGEVRDEYGGYTIEICQVEWGHVARKRTWLYIVGACELPPPPFPGRSPTHWVGGSRTTRAHGTPVPAGIKVCSAQQRRRTPPLLADALVALARACRKVI